MPIHPYNKLTERRHGIAVFVTGTTYNLKVKNLIPRVRFWDQSNSSYKSKTATSVCRVYIIPSCDMYNAGSTLQGHCHLNRIS